MATNTLLQYTLQHLAEATHNDKVLAIAETMTRKNQFLQDAVFVEANDPTTHTFSYDASLPSGSWAQINKGTAAEVYLQTQGKETMGKLESISRVDKRLVDLAGDKAVFRSQRDKKYIEGLSQTLTKAFFFGDPGSDIGSIQGLAKRSNWGATANTGYVTNGGATYSSSTTSSIWVVEWDEVNMYLVYPKGHPHVGIRATDMGLVPQTDADGNRYYAYETLFEIAAGIVTADPRCVQRYAKVDTSASSTSTGFDEIKLLKTIGRLPSRGQTGRTVIYVNRDMYNAFDARAAAMTNAAYTRTEDVFGAPLVKFRGIPVKMVESMDTGNAAENIS